MIEKIIANGRPGAAAAALEIAIKLGLAHGGWCRGDESAADKFGLARLPGAAAGSVTEKAVRAGHGTLYFTAGQTASSGPDLGLEMIKKSTLRLNKPLLVQNLGRESGFSASRRIAEWIDGNRIRILHVDGEAEKGSKSPSLASRVTKILEATFFLAMMGSGITSPLPSVVRQTRQLQQDLSPQTIDAALNQLERSLSLKDRATIANLTADELISLHFTLGDYINNHFNLFIPDSPLLTDCRRHSSRWNLVPEDAAAVIIRALWERLRATCRIRIVK